jgi:chromosome segregation ATPase
MNSRMESSRVRASSDRLRVSAQKTQFNRDKDVNEALRCKMESTKDCINELNKALGETVREIQEHNDSKARLERAIFDKNEPLAVANACLERRTQRPNREMVRDIVEESLEEEVSDLQAGVNALRADLSKTNRDLAELNRARQEIEADLSDKKGAHDLDSECLRLRLDRTSRIKRV